MKNYKIAAIPGDGIGEEVISAGVEVLQHMAQTGAEFTIDVETFPWGADYYFEHGQMMPDKRICTELAPICEQQWLLGTCLQGTPPRHATCTQVSV